MSKKEQNIATNVNLLYALYFFPLLNPIFTYNTPLNIFIFIN